MAPIARLALASLTIFDSLINVASVSAFSTGQSSASINPKSPFLNNRLPVPSTADCQIRGGSAPNGSTTAMASTPTAAVDPAAKSKKVRISAFDSMRFFLITCIVLGHFIKFANPSDFVFKFFRYEYCVLLPIPMTSESFARSQYFSFR